MKRFKYILLQLLIEIMSNKKKAWYKQKRYEKMASFISRQKEIEIEEKKEQPAEEKKKKGIIGFLKLKSKTTD